MAKAGVIGAGLLGTACVHRLTQAGFEVVAYDVDEAKRTAIAQLGAHTAASVADTVRKCFVIVVAVFSIDQVEQVIEGEGGVLETIGKGSASPVVICCSTCDPDRLALLAARAKSRGLRILEVPISGSSRQVSEGDGVGLVGGDSSVLDEASPVLDAICPRRFYLGDVGSGSRAKLAVNLILGLNRGALAEGLVFAERLGLDREAFLKVARGSAAYSQVMDIQGAAMVHRDYLRPQARVDQSLKDFHLMLAQAGTQGQQLPFATVYAEMLANCVRNGEAEWDNAAIAEAITRCRTA